ncbi:DUF3592 domain-containing protein [Chitinophaga ginsengisoli]|uniref:Uncharacterized protein DUF3592 n=1 Tax=Chitinophaga ginsengisoli TaxID=363837 RepID=A0A2P8FDW9_9BACT|nr:DUF3592 domain-containing protein [Chitinophaga ginsengisoli]PSL19907.1 uncharacterized protein DUF3592 [Chitinophaga ginsengisoli]
MKRRIIWGALLLLTFLIWYIWMPAGLYIHMPVFVAIIGGILCFIFMAQTFADFTDMDEITQWDRYPKQWYHNMTFVCIPAAIVLIIVFAMHYGKLENEELRQFGQIVPATIVDGYYKKSSKSSTYKLTISYYTKDGKQVRTQKEVGSDQYDLASKGQHVEVVYSSKHPNLVKILLGDEMVEELTGMKSRQLTVKDMSQILAMPGDSILPALNKISYRWITADDDSTTYVNENKKLFFSAQPRVRVTYVAMGENLRSMMQDIRNSGFQKDASDTTSHDKEEGGLSLYTKGDLKLVVHKKEIEREVDQSDNSAVMAAAMGLNKEVALVVTMFRN